MIVAWRRAAIVSVLIGLGLRLCQYASASSIWVDEAAIARNVLDRDPASLLAPLDYGQVASPGFLLGVKLSSALLGDSELALRLVPLVAGLAAVALFAALAFRILRPVPAFAAILMFSTAAPLVYFTSILKQYSSDVAVALAVFLLAHSFHTRRMTPAATALYGLAAAPLLFLSEAAIFSVTAAGAAVTAEALLSRRDDTVLRLTVVALWASACVAILLHGFESITPADGVYLRSFWAAGFPPHDIGAVGWLWRTLSGFFGPPGPYPFDGSLHYAWPTLFVALAALGSVALAREKPFHAALLVGSIVLMLAASAVGAYPFGRRVGLLLLPSLIVLSTSGACGIGRMLSSRGGGELVPLVLLPLSLAGLWLYPPPYRPEHLRPVLEHVAANRQPGDAVWVYYGAGQAFEYYRRRIPIGGDDTAAGSRDAAGRSGNILLGECDRTELRAFLHQLDAVRGRARVWIVLSHDFGLLAVTERSVLARYLDTIGLRLDAFHAPEDDRSAGRAEALLFDLSREDRLASASADTFPVGKGYPEQAWTCYGTMSPHGESERTLQALMRQSRPNESRPR